MPAARVFKESRRDKTSLTGRLHRYSKGVFKHRPRSGVAAIIARAWCWLSITKQHDQVPQQASGGGGFSAGLRPYLAGANGLLGVLLSQRVEVWQCVLVQLRHVIQHNLCPACDVEVLGCMAHLAE